MRLLIVQLFAPLQSAGKLTQMGLPESSVFEVDVASGNTDTMAKAFEGCDALVIATSGVPKIKYLSLIKVFWAKLTKQEGVRPDFGWSNDQLPEQVRTKLRSPVPCCMYLLGYGAGTQPQRQGWEHRVADVSEHNQVNWQCCDQPFSSITLVALIFAQQ